MGSGLVKETAWRLTRRKSLNGAAETACSSESTVRSVVSKKSEAARLRAVSKERRLLRKAFFQIKAEYFMTGFYHVGTIDDLRLTIYDWKNGSAANRRVVFNRQSSIVNRQYE